MEPNSPSRVSFTFSDPWELGGTEASGNVTETATGTSERILLSLDVAIEHRGVTYRSLLVSPRLEGQSLFGIKQGRSVPSNAFGLENETTLADALSIASRWRGGGLAAIGKLSPALAANSVGSRPQGS